MFHINTLFHHMKLASSIFSVTMFDFSIPMMPGYFISRSPALARQACNIFVSIGVLDFILFIYFLNVSILTSFTLFDVPTLISNFEIRGLQIICLSDSVLEGLKGNKYGCLLHTCWIPGDEDNLL
jgi:hypothetical protein